MEGAKNKEKVRLEDPLSDGRSICQGRAEEGKNWSPGGSCRESHEERHKGGMSPKTGQGAQASHNLSATKP